MDCDDRLGSTPANDRATDTGVSWLWDPANDPASAGPVMCAPGDVSALIADALARAGLGEVAVIGVVRDPRRRRRTVTFDLVEQRIGATGPSATLACVVRENVLNRTPLLADAMTVRVWGELGWDPHVGRVHVVAERVDVLEPPRRVAVQPRRS
jgi:hypothetical protein